VLLLTLGRRKKIKPRRRRKYIPHVFLDNSKLKISIDDEKYAIG
jgi:hypothetical protein